MKLTSVEIHPDVSPIDALDIVEFKWVSLTNPAGPVFIFGSYNAVTDTFKLYENGVLVSTQTGLGNTVINVPVTKFFAGGAPLTGTKVYDELAFGVGVVSDATVAALYSAASDYDMYVATQMAMNPSVYYHLNSIDPVFDLLDASGNGRDLIDNNPTNTHMTFESSLIAGSHGATGANTAGGPIGLYVSPTPLNVLNSSWWMCGWVDNVNDYVGLIQIERFGGGALADIGVQPNVPGTSHFLSITRFYPPDFGLNIPFTLEPIVLSFRDPRGLNQYNVKSIDGLDASAIISRYYASGGAFKFHNLSVEGRNIIIKVGLNPSFVNLETYSGLRDTLYRMISSSRIGQIKIHFKNGTEVVALLSGYISKVEAPLFEKAQEISLTVVCDEPLLKAPVPIDVDVSGLDPDDTVINDVDSTAPHGFLFSMYILNPISGLIIKNPGDASWQFRVVPVGGFLAGDNLYFSSDGVKSLYMVRDSVDIELGDAITTESIWPIMFPGINHFSVNHPTDVIWNSISYYPTYWGV